MSQMDRHTNWGHINKGRRLEDSLKLILQCALCFLFLAVCLLS